MKGGILIIRSSRGGEGLIEVWLEGKCCLWDGVDQKHLRELY
jgi:hypothetical protein